MKRIDITTEGWDQYRLVDSGEGRKLEQFGSVRLDRPDPQSVWKKQQPSAWAKSDAIFSWAEKGERWKEINDMPQSWHVSYETLVFNLSLKQLKHVGLFPEHEPQWKELIELCRDAKGIRVLNLFGYTGASSLAAAYAGAEVTHIDASKQAIAIVRQNIQDSGLPADAIRLVCEDAIRYTKRLIQREEQFEVVVMDPPAFGRGPKGEVWKIEEGLAELVALIPQILSPHAKLVILNGYAAGYAARTFAELLRDAMQERKGEIIYGDVSLKQQSSERMLTTGIYAKWKQRS